MFALLLILTLASTSVLADDEDTAALLLADRTSDETLYTSDWRIFTEAAWSQSTLRSDNTHVDSGRLSLDLHYDKRLDRNLRAVFADRFDATWQDSFSQDNSVNTLKEGYLTWQGQPDLIADIGRVNARYGVASGYNPTDYFRAGAVRSIVSVDPVSLRENRLGSVMLRGQALWTTGALTALYSPKLATTPSDEVFNPDFGASNHRDRWLLIVSQKLFDDLNPQWLLYGEAGKSLQLGINLTTLLNNATVVYAEWSGGRGPSLLSKASLMPDDTTFRSRLAAGMTYTAPNKLSLTLEYEYNGAGLDRESWNALRRDPSSDYGQYRELAAVLQDPPTRHRVFLRVMWQDAFIYHLDLTTNVFFNAIDSSRLSWIEARYHWMHIDVALRSQSNSGQPGSEYGALRERHIWEALIAYYF